MFQGLCSSNSEVLIFEEFEFSYHERSLMSNNNVIKLTKMEANALALFCFKNNKPVTLSEFNKYVWKGRYVTSQSLAQLIRALRVKLNDKNKSIIVTMPKLGYKLMASPVPMDKNKEGTIHLDDEDITKRLDVVLSVINSIQKTITLKAQELEEIKASIE